jgi:hypothetical protein
MDISIMNMPNVESSSKALNMEGTAEFQSPAPGHDIIFTDDTPNKSESIIAP